MKVENKKEEKIVYPIIEMENHGRLILPDHIITQINYLHGRVGTKEWSGMLFYDVKSGNPAKPEDFVLEAKDIFLMDIGTGAYTEYETDGDIVDYYDNKPEEAMQWKTGHVHSHHNMAAFFSGTDNDELNDNVDKHNYYLSLIVNFAGKFVAKVAFLSNIHLTSKMNYVDDSGKIQHFKTNDIKKAMVIIEMDIYYDYDDPIFYKRYNQVVNKVEEAEKKKALKTKYKSWTPNNSSIYSKDKDDEDYFYALPQGRNFKPIDADPKNMKTFEVEKLARNLFSITTDLSEMRSIYAILYQLADAPDKDIEFYYDFLADNVEIIIENFFDQSLDNDEMKVVLGEVIDSLIRFKNNSNLSNICDGITEVLQEFGLHYEKLTDEETIEEQLENEQLDLEFQMGRT